MFPPAHLGDFPVESRTPRKFGLVWRWFPGPWAVVVFALPLLAYAFYAVRSSSRLYQLEVMLTTDRPVMMQVAFDSGSGFAETDSAQCFVPAASNPVAASFPISAGQIRSWRISPVDSTGAVTIRSASIRTTVKIPAQRRTYFTFAPAAFHVDRKAGSAPSSVGGDDLRLETAAGSPTPVCIVTPSSPVLLRMPWLLVCVRWVTFAFGWLLWWIVLAEGARRLPPVRLIWLVAAASVMLSTYPVIFLSKSFLGIDYIDGPQLLYASPSTLPGAHNLLADDHHGADVFAMFNAIAPYSQVQHRAIFRDGEWPLWDRYDEGGLALLGQGQSMFGDPLHFIVIAANGRAWAWDVKFLLAKWLFAAGVGLLVLATTDCLPVALLLAASSAFIGFFAYRLNHPAYFSVCYSPWILLAWTGIVRAGTWRGSMRWAGGLIVANWMEMTSGTAKEAYMLLAGLNGTGVLMLLIGRLPLRAKGKRFAGLAVAGGLFCLLAAPFLLSFFDTLAKSGSSYDNPIAYQLQPSLLIGLFDDIFLREFDWNEGVLGPSLNGLVLLGVLLAFGGARRLLGNRTFLATALASLPAFALVFGVVPPTLICRLPFLRNIYHVDNTFSCVLLPQCFVLAGFGFKDCLTYTGRFWRRDVLVGLAVGGVLAGAYYGALNAQQRSNFLLQPTPAITVSPFFTWYAPSILLALLPLPFVLRSLYWRGPRTLGMVVLFGCLWLLHWRMAFQGHPALSPYSPALPDRVDLLARSAAVDRLRADRSEPFRVFGWGGVFAPGYGAMVDVESIIGLDALWNPYIQTFDAAAEAETGATFMDTTHPEMSAAQKPFHDLLGVRYYLTMPDDPLSELPNVAPAERLDLNVYRNDAAWPRAFFVDRLGIYDGVAGFAGRVVSGDGNPVAEIDTAQIPSLPPGVAGRFSEEQGGRTVEPASNYRLTNHRTYFDVNSPSAGVIVLMEPYVDRDITGTINGRPVPVWRVNHAFRGMVVDQPGTYHVMVNYVPRGFTLSLYAAGLGVALCAVAGWWLWRREPRPMVLPL